MAHAVAFQYLMTAAQILSWSLGVWIRIRTNFFLLTGHVRTDSDCDLSTEIQTKLLLHLSITYPMANGKQHWHVPVRAIWNLCELVDVCGMSILWSQSEWNSESKVTVKVCSMQQHKFTITDGNSNWKAVPHTSWTDYLQLPHHRWIWWCCTTHDGWVLSCSDKTTFAFAAFPFDDASVGPLASRNGHPMVKNRFNSWSCHSKQSCGRYQDVNLRVGAPPFESVNKHSQRWRAFFAAGCSHETGVRSTTSAMSFSKQSLCSPRCHQSYNDNTDNTRLD